ncbi:hypothetical protein NBRC116594_32690 [Shimia sp. NS0008-38b]|uniref:hypothetical protein n=1 Tax=Shimia sp. NS0008-38b TaxID=3127653 RepID=UPI0031072F08
MRFIRDIIADKTQGISQDDTAALRYPLHLREEDRADIVPPASEMDTIAPPEPSAPSAEVQPARNNVAVDLSAISAAVSSQAEHPTQVSGPENPTQAIRHAPERAQTPDFEETSPAHLKEPDFLPVSDPEHFLKSEGAIGTQPIESPTAPQDSAADIAPSTRLSLEREGTAVNAAAPTTPMSTGQPAQIETEGASPEDELADLQMSVSAHKPASGRGSKGRVKTRLLGFGAPSAMSHDPLSQSREATVPSQAHFPVGWLVVIDGPGKGSSFSLFDGLTQLGRGEGQTVRLDFGDNTISRENHAAIAFDAEQRQFFFGHGGKANLVRLNGRPVLSTEVLDTNSVMRIGETTLKFVALCGEDFAWNDAEAGHAEFG